jgi:hypothetical protein
VREPIGEQICKEGTFEEDALKKMPSRRCLEEERGTRPRGISKPGS